MTGLQILLTVLIVVFVAAAMTAMWLRHRRAGGVLIADPTPVATDRGVVS